MINIKLGAVTVAARSAFAATQAHVGRGEVLPGTGAVVAVQPIQGGDLVRRKRQNTIAGATTDCRREARKDLDRHQLGIRRNPRGGLAGDADAVAGDNPGHVRAMTTPRQRFGAGLGTIDRR